jgi:FKBP-type peptidyl-prolyl cis-trans isomerase
MFAATGAEAGADRTIVTQRAQAGSQQSAPSPAGLVIFDQVIGTGRSAQKGDLVSVRYVGTLTSGTVFDSTNARGPFQFRLGGGSVIAGFDQGVLGMKIGGKRRVTIPPAMGYGARGAPPTIPPNSVIVFDLELVAIQ